MKYKANTCTLIHIKKLKGQITQVYILPAREIPNTLTPGCHNVILDTSRIFPTANSYDNYRSSTSSRISLQSNHSVPFYFVPAKMQALLLSIAALSFAAAQTVSIPAIIHDYFPCITAEWAAIPPNGKTSQFVMANCNPDIERGNYGLGRPNRGMIKNQLDANRKPIYNMVDAPNGVTNSTYQVVSSTSFNKWVFVITFTSRYLKTFSW